MNENALRVIGYLVTSHKPWNYYHRNYWRLSTYDSLTVDDYITKNCL